MSLGLACDTVLASRLIVLACLSASAFTASVVCSRHALCSA